MNAFRQLHLNIKSNLPPPFCSGAVAERDELCQCAPGEGKGADEAHWEAWEQAGMVQETDFRITCTFSEDAGQERGRPVLASRATHVSLRLFSEGCKRLSSGLKAMSPMFWPDLWCSFLIMSGGHL